MLLALKMQVQVHNMKTLGCKYVLDNLIINIKYDYVLGFKVVGPPWNLTCILHTHLWLSNWLKP